MYYPGKGSLLSNLGIITLPSSGEGLVICILGENILRFREVVCYPTLKDRLFYLFLKRFMIQSPAVYSSITL